MQIKIFTIVSALFMAAAPVAADCVGNCWLEYFTCVGNNIPEPTCGVGRSKWYSWSNPADKEKLTI